MSSSTWVPPANGISGGYGGDNRHILQAMSAFSAIAWYNSIELMVIVLLFFKKYKGLYFWSLMVTSFSVIVYQVGAYGKMVQIAPNPVVTEALTNVGWVFMIGGNSLVLYSRLHLITQNPVLLRCVFWGILVNTLVLYVPTTALSFGINITPNPAWANGYAIMERVQMTLFCVQEFAISGVYLVECYRFLRIAYEGSTRRLMYELLAVNVALIVLDVALLSVEYVDLYEIEITLKGMVYSIKLKLELGVLSRLVKIATKRDTNRGSSLDPEACLDNAKADTIHTERSSLPWINPLNGVGAVGGGSPQLGSEKYAQGAEHLDFVTTAGVATENGNVQSGDEGATGLGTEPERRVQRPKPSRESSISNMYPGRIRGG